MGIRFFFPAMPKFYPLVVDTVIKDGLKITDVTFAKEIGPTVAQWAIAKRDNLLNNKKSPYREALKQCELPVVLFRYTPSLLTCLKYIFAGCKAKLEKKAKEALDKENSDCNASLAEDDSVEDESTAKEEGIKAPTIVECLEALATDPNVKRLTTDKVVEAADFFLNVGLVPLVPALRSSTGLHSWQILKGDAWEVEMATAATFIQEASALDNIIYNIKAGKDGTKKKREKMFTKTKMPEICMTYCKHRDEFKAIKEDPNLMRVMASWEKKCGIYREPEESSAKKRARLGPAPNEMNAPAKSECKQHVSNFFPTSLTCHQCKQENSPKSVYLSCRTILLCSGPCQLCSHCMIQNQICPHCVMKLTPPIPFKLQRFRLD